MLRGTYPNRSISLRVLLVTILWLGVSSLTQAQVRTAVLTYPSGGKNITIECFGPGDPGRYPTVLLLYGSGGLEQATGDVFREVASTLARRGYVAMIPHYFERTDHVIGASLKNGEYEAMMATVADAVDFASKQSDVDPDRFAFIGYSMGANLARLQGVKDARIKAITCVSGAFAPIAPKKTMPAMLILQGSKDSSTPLAYVKKYQEGLEANQTPNTVHIYKGVGHNFSVENWADVTNRSAAFFDKHVKKAKSKP